MSSSERIPLLPKADFSDEIRKDLQYLSRLIDLLSGQETDPPISIESVNQILITGATGFIAPSLVYDLLRRRDDMVLYCIVRAENDAHAANRIRQKLEWFNLWEDAFADRIHAIAGDITQVNFGIEPARYENLCSNVQAVFHCAAHIDLVGSYKKLRQVNVFGLQSILELCMRKRLKHLFYTSTLGIFPEYMWSFREEFKNHFIEHQAQPRLEELKRLLPPEVGGYSWSKVVSEQLLLYANSYGLPIGIFRFPATTYMESGHTHDGLIGVRLIMATHDLQMKIRSKLAPIMSYDTTDTITRMMASIALNPQRRYTIYQCCNSNPRVPDTTYAGINISHYKEVSYDEFRAACMARGEQSPLFGQLHILDFYRKYWFDAESEAEGMPVDTRAILEDCPHTIEWLGGLSVLARSERWQRDHPDLWPYPITTGELDFDTIVAVGEVIADRWGVPLESVNPRWAMDAMLEWITSINQLRESKGRTVSSAGRAYSLNRSFQIRMDLFLERKNYPEIGQERISQPVFIVGLNRTGTTFLHRMLARDPQFWTLKMYQILEPSIPHGRYGTTDQFHIQFRYGQADDQLSAFEAMMGGFKSFQHEIGANLPEEEGFFLTLCCMAWEDVVRQRNPKFNQYLLSADFGPAYEFHHSLLQHFSYRFRQTSPTGQWLLKYPFHLNQLEDLIKVYPDARFIMPHRPLSKVVGSFCSLVHSLRGEPELNLAKAEFGQEQLQFLSNMANRAVKFRESRPDLEDRWLDISFFDLIESPVTVIDTIYHHLGRTFSKEVRLMMEKELDSVRAKIKTRKKHQYDIADYDLTSQDIETAFAPYLSFIERRRIFESEEPVLSSF